MEELILRSHFQEPDALASYVVALRRDKASAEKIATSIGLSFGDYRRLMANRRFRQLCSEQLALHVLDLEAEERIMGRFVDDAQHANDVWQRRAAAQYLDQKGGLERAKESRVEHGGRLTVEFTIDPTAASSGRGNRADWAPPDPMAGVIGAEGGRALPGPRSQGELPADADEAPEAAEGAQASRRRFVDTGLTLDV